MGPETSSATASWWSRCS